MISFNRALFYSGLRTTSYFLRPFSLATNPQKLILTPSCIKRLKFIERGDTILRILVDSGGCSGFQYKFELTERVEQDDELIEEEGVKVVIDKVSMSLLQGATVDYQEELIRSGFQISQNPLADKGCSCGVSFSLKMD